MNIKNIPIIIIFLLGFHSSMAQELQKVRDTINHFEIGVPIGWKYGVPKNNSLAFMALREKVNADDMAENLNINILYRAGTDINTSYRQFLEARAGTNNFEIIEQKDKVIFDRKYKYLVENHKNKFNGISVTNVVLFTNSDGKILILTIISSSANYEKNKNLFDSIGNSLRYYPN